MSNKRLQRTRPPRGGRAAEPQRQAMLGLLLATSPQFAKGNALIPSVHRVGASDAAVLGNLLQLYCHDMAEWLLLEANQLGLYSYPLERVERVWRDEIDAYIARIEGIPIGFAFVGSAEPYIQRTDTRDMTEFFVVRRHRGAGVGSALANDIWGRYPGNWLVRVARPNSIAMGFWRNAVARYCGGSFSEDERSVALKNWTYFSFSVPTSQSPSPHAHHAP